jgi:hypothetical protein
LKRQLSSTLSLSNREELIEGKPPISSSARSGTQDSGIAAFEREYPFHLPVRSSTFVSE